MSSLKPITVILAEDHQIVREGLRVLIQTEPDIKVVGEADNGRKAVEMAANLQPNVIVMDIAMPLLNGLEATRQILKAAPSTRILVLSAHSDPAYVDQVVSLGAAGFLTKQTAAHILPKAIRDVARGKTYFSPTVAKHLSRDQNSAPGRSGIVSMKPVALTSREMEVLQLIAEGKANKETAAELGICIKTVEKHREHLMAKLNIHDTATLTRYAISTGVIESSVQVTTI
jgi:DNA-binding NarL/FixJ family response regulator